MDQGPKVFRCLVEELARLPGIGEKTAQRLVFSMVRSDQSYIDRLVAALVDLKERLRLCAKCCGLTDEETCSICREMSRDHYLICVVEDASHLFAIERSGQYRGLYHVLHGSLAPLEGVGPGDLRISELMQRVTDTPPREVILATNPDVEGEATAVYLAKQLQEKGIPTTRIAMGVPMGGHLEYTDQFTIGRAIVERRQFTAT